MFNAIYKKTMALFKCIKPNAFSMEACLRFIEQLNNNNTFYL